MKSIFESKLFWLNLIATLTGILDVVRVLDIPAEWLQYGAVAVALANVVLRVWFTDKALFISQPKDEQIG